MIDQFPYINENAYIINKYGSAIIKNAANKSIRTLSGAAFAAVRECNGRNSMKQVIMGTVINYFDGSDISDYINKTISFFEELSELEFILCSDTPSDKAVRILDVPQICYPDNIVFELTDFCNLNCTHCYRNSDPTKSAFINTEKLLAAIEELSKYGLKSVHITGGEPSTHPDFLKIVEGALDFCQNIVILSNGTNFDERSFEVFKRYNDRIILQVDLDGSTSTIHDALRGVPGAFDLVAKAIKSASSQGIQVEVAMNIHKGNFQCIEETILLAKQLGASSFTCTPVMEYGRGASMEILDEEYTYKFLMLLQVIYEKYAGLVRKTEVSTDDMEKRLNCGAGHRNLTCSPEGDLRPCVLLPSDMIAMGNLFNEKIDELFAKPIYKHFAALQAPNKETCGDCQFTLPCLGCFARPLLTEEKMKASVPGFYCKRKESILACANCTVDNGCNG